MCASEVLYVCDLVFPAVCGMLCFPDRGLMRTRSVVGGLLPNPRVISLQLHQVPPARSSLHNVLVMQMGQFIDHDFSITSVVKGKAPPPYKNRSGSLIRTWVMESTVDNDTQEGNKKSRSEIL